MATQVSVAQQRASLADLLGAVYYGKEPVVVARKGKPFAAVISSEQYAQYQAQANERIFRAADELSRLNAEEDPVEVLRFVTEVVEEVRQEHYEREHHTDSGDR